jgi:8-oxo-dGTP diphosphatase
MSSAAQTKWVHVAVGVIYDTHGNILIAQRAASAHQGGFWEFPGGKLDAGESPVAALIRELKEELDITPTQCEPLIQIRHHYKDKSVLLDVYKVLDFEGEPKGNEGQPIRWVPMADLSRYDFPAANRPIVTAINLPHELCILGRWTDLNRR